MCREKPSISGFWKPSKSGLHISDDDRKVCKECNGALSLKIRKENACRKFIRERI